MENLDAGLVLKLQSLAGYFNRGSLDIPDGLIGRGCVFVLNGVAYEDTLGRPAADPLTRLVGRGHGAFRFIAQGLRNAVPDVHVRLDDFVPDDGGSAAAWRGRAVVEGTPRGDDTFGALADVRLELGDNGDVVRVDVRMDEAPLASIADARRR